MKSYFSSDSQDLFVGSNDYHADFFNILGHDNLYLVGLHDIRNIAPPLNLIKPYLCLPKETREFILLFNEHYTSQYHRQLNRLKNRATSTRSIMKKYFNRWNSVLENLVLYSLNKLLREICNKGVKENSLDKFELQRLNPIPLSSYEYID